MKLNQFHESYDEDSNPEFDEYLKKEIASKYQVIEQLPEGGLVPLDPHAYDVANASQANIQEWFNVLVVNDTENDDYTQALNVAQTPVAQFLMEHNDDYVLGEVVPQLKQLVDGLGDRFTISQLAATNTKWLEIAASNTHSLEDIRNDPDLGARFSDDSEYAKDPSAYHGVRNSDFL